MDMMIICFSCDSMKLFNEGIRYYLTSCGHLFCEKCIITIEKNGICKTCKNSCRLLNLSSKDTPTEVKEYFNETHVTFKSFLSKISKINEFQATIRERFKNAINEKNKESEKNTEEAIKAKKVTKAISDENELLKCELEEKLTEIEELEKELSIASSNNDHSKQSFFDTPKSKDGINNSLIKANNDKNENTTGIFSANGFSSISPPTFSCLNSNDHHSKLSKFLTVSAPSTPLPFKSNGGHSVSPIRSTVSTPSLRSRFHSHVGRSTSPTLLSTSAPSLFSPLNSQDRHSATQRSFLISPPSRFKSDVDRSPSPIQSNISNSSFSSRLDPHAGSFASLKRFSSSTQSLPSRLDSNDRNSTTQRTVFVSTPSPPSRFKAGSDHSGSPIGSTISTPSLTSRFQNMGLPSRRFTRR